MFYSEEKKQYSILNRRSFFLYVLKLSLFSIVGWRLYNIQIKDSEKYKTLSKNNQIDMQNETSTFTLKLSREKIQLLLMNDKGMYQEIGSTDPNASYLLEDLKAILGQLNALTDNFPVVDVMLPDELILVQNLHLDAMLHHRGTKRPHGTFYKIQFKGMYFLDQNEMFLPSERPCH